MQVTGCMLTCNLQPVTCNKKNMEYGKSELLRLLRNTPREGWSDKKIKDLVDSLWRDKYPGADEVIYGYVTWEGGLNFKGSKAYFRLNNKLYNAPAKPLTCAAADDTYDRIDLVALSTDKEWVILPGTAAEYPMPPSNYDRDKYLAAVPITIPALATEPANMVEGQIYNEHIAGEWTPSVVGTTANWESTTTPSKGSKCAAIGPLTNGDQLIFTAPEDYRDTDWATLSFDLRLPNTSSRGHFIEAYFTYNGRSRSKLVPAIFSRSVTGWQTVVFAMPDFEVRNTLFNGLVLRWSNLGGATYAGIEIDNVRLQKGIELPGTTDNYVTGANWDEATGTLTLHRTGSLGDITVTITGAGGGADGREVEMSVSGGYIVWRYVGETVWNNLVALASLVGPPGTPGDDGAPGSDGEDGVPVEISVQGGWVCWRYVGAASWTQLYEIPAGGGASVIQVTGLTLVVANWVADGSLYKYVLSDANITATSSVEVIPANASYDVLVVAEPMPETVSATGTVTMWVKNVPSADIPVTINITEVV